MQKKDHCRLTRSRPKKLTISNSISNSIINNPKASTTLPTASSNSISNSDSTTGTQRLKQLTERLLTILHPTYGKRSQLEVTKNQQASAVK